MHFIIFSLICFIGGVLSSVVGVGGGILVLSLILTTTPFLVGSALHSIIMMIANIQKAIMLKSYVKRDVVLRFIAGAIPGALTGAFVVSLIPEHIMYFVFGIFLLIFCFLEIIKTGLNYSVRLKDFYWIGGVTGFSAGVLGAPGPIHAPFFMKYGLSKEAFIATASMTTLIVHLSKIGVFLNLGVFEKIQPIMLILGIVNTLIGVYVGVIFLKKMRSETFDRIMVYVLGILGTYYILKASKIL